MSDIYLCRSDIANTLMRVLYIYIIPMSTVFSQKSQKIIYNISVVSCGTFSPFSAARKIQKQFIFGAGLFIAISVIMMYNPIWPALKAFAPLERHKSMKKTLKTILIVLAAALLVCLGAIAIFYLRVNDPGNVFADAPVTREPVTVAPEATVTQTPPAAPPEASAAPVEPTPEPTATPISEAELEGMADLSFMKNRVNILVMGIDRSVERAESNSFRSDTIILVTVNFKTGDVDMITFPRDSYVKLYDKDGLLIDELDPFNKINEAFSRGGMMKHGGYQSEMNTVSRLIGGIPVSYYVSFDMNAVKEIVDAMGGVDYEVDIDVYMNGRELHPGLQHLDGQAVLDYCRQRKGSSDTARADRQQRMLMAIFEQMKSTGQIANIPKIYKAVSDCIDTDLSFEQICSLSLIAVRMDSEQLNRHMVKGKFASLYQRDVWLVDAEKLKTLIKDVFNADVIIDPEVDGEAILANAALNNAAIQNELYTAANLYNEAKSFVQSYGSYISSGTKSRLSSLRGELNTAIRRECKPYLDIYSAQMNELLDLAYAEAGLTRTNVSVPDYSYQTPSGGGLFSGGMMGFDGEAED